jgi:hypothetical protein
LQSNHQWVHERSPVQVLIIDVNNGNSIVSATDSRSTWAGSVNEQKSLFFDESGDMYIFCVASYGFGGPSQKCGFLRIKSGETSFDPNYFFNVADYSIDGVPGSKVDYLQRMRYAGTELSTQQEIFTRWQAIRQTMSMTEPTGALKLTSGIRL